MKFSEAWLREWVSPKASTEALVEKLTMAGLEVDGIEPVAGAFSGVVVGEITEANPHPNADKLQVCRVLGPNAETFDVVCGAPNARAGIKVPFATIGAVLPGDFKIKKAKLRGVESFGMLCAQTELQAGDDDGGLWELPSDAPVGEDLRNYLNLDDTIIEVDLTPNRSDCLGLKGLAREVGVLYREDVSAIQVSEVPPSTNNELAVELKAPKACPRYFGRVISGIDASAQSPLWLQEKLRRSDIRPIDAVVDITNYILLELGQPMHAFDLDKIEQGIQVRMASSGEKLALLNDQEIELSDGSLVIADANKPLALAGVMGGAESSVTLETSNIFLESAFFDPIAIAGKARSYGLHTDSSHRFERGVDFETSRQAIERATQLILDIAGGQAGPVTCAELEEHVPTEREVKLRRARIEKGLGFAIPDDEIEDILQRLGLTLKRKVDDGWMFAVPSYRFDLAIEADLLEELARIYGYNNLPTTTNLIPQKLPSKSESELDRSALFAHLIARDYNEVITYSFIDPELHKQLFPGQNAVELMNPISSDLSVMRTSLVPGLLKTLESNVNRQHARVRIFEHGLKFVPGDSSLRQTESVAGLIYGLADDESWLGAKAEVDFYDIKGDLETMLAIGGVTPSFTATDAHPHMHPGQTAAVTLSGETIGYVGALHPELAKGLSHTKTVFVFEVDLKPVLAAKVPVFSGISRFPEVERDLAFVVRREISVANLQQEISVAAGENLKELKVFDIYSGEGIDSQRKSAAFHLTFQHSSRTLNEDEVNAAINAVVKQVEMQFGASLR